MMINRHVIPDLERVRHRFDRSCERLTKVVGYSKNRAASLYGAIGAAWDVILFGSVVQPDSSEIPRAIQVGAQAGTAMFEVLRAGEEPIRFELGDGERITSQGTVDSSNAHSGTWLQGFYLAVLSRRNELVSSLCQTPVMLLQQSSTKGPAFHDLFVDAVEAVWNKAGSAKTQIEAAMAATNPARPDIRTPEWDTHWWIPQMELLLCLDNGLKDFGKMLEKALLLHKDYFGKTAESRGQQWGFLAVPIMVFAILAHDRGFTVNVESDYFLDGLF